MLIIKSDESHHLKVNLTHNQCTSLIEKPEVKSGRTGGQ